MTIVSINQPAYLPWLGYFDRIMKSDVHVILDHVTLGKDGMFNRNKIRTQKGWQWLTIPIKKRGDATQLRDIEPATSSWARKHLAQIQANYRTAPFYERYRSDIEALYMRAHEAPAQHASTEIEGFTGFFLSAFDIGYSKISYSSELINVKLGKKSQLNLDICKHLGASVYLSGPNGRNYLDLEAFADAGIEVRYHDYVTPRYRQCFEGFETNMSALDALLCCGAFPTEELIAEAEITGQFSDKYDDEIRKIRAENVA